MRAGGGKVVLDSVHGLMEFEGPNTLLVQVLESEELQRLRRIRQLGLAHLVYPGAEHSRLPHSLGAAFSMQQVMQRLRKEAEELLPSELRPDAEVVRDSCLAALCHDLGHGPMSHAFENIVLRDWRRDEWTQSTGLGGIAWIPNDLQWHELVTIGLLLNPDGDLHRRLERHAEGLSVRVAQFIVGKHHLPYLPALIAGEFDVDRFDYVLRDSKNAGIRQSFDREWLLDSLTFAVNPEQEDQVVVALDGTRGTHTIEQFLRNRLTLYRRLYKHKTVRSAELLLGKLLERLRVLALADQVRLSRPGFEQALAKLLRGDALSCNEVLRLDDFRLWSLILDFAEESGLDPTLRSLARMLARRDLPKLVRNPNRDLAALARERSTHDTIDNVVEKYVAGEPRFFWMQDEVTFRLVDPDARFGCWILTRRGSPPVVRHLRDIPEIRSAVHDHSEFRLYVPDESLKEVRTVLGV
jgi:uncharacterized protein